MIECFREVIVIQYVLLTMAVVFTAVNFLISKIYQKCEGTTGERTLYFNALVGLFTAIVVFFINGCKVEFTGYSFVMASIYNTLIMAYTIAGFKIMESGSMALYMIFLMSGGMLVPYIWGILFLDEAFSWFRFLGVVVISFGVALPNLTKEKVDKKQLLYCLFVFVLNGFTSVTSKVHQVEQTFPIVDTNSFVIMGNMFKFVFAAVLWMIIKKKSGGQKKRNHYMLLIMLASAVVSSFASMLQIGAATTVPATVLYPFMTGGTVVFTSLAGVLFFKDKLSKKLVASIPLCFIGTLLFL